LKKALFVKHQKENGVCTNQKTPCKMYRFLFSVLYTFFMPTEFVQNTKLKNVFEKNIKNVH